MSRERVVGRFRVICLGVIVVLVLVGGLSIRIAPGQTAGREAGVAPEKGGAEIQNQLSVLEDHRRHLRAKIEVQRAQMRGLLEPYGTSNLEDLYGFELRRLGLIQDEATKVNLHQIHLESRLAVLKRHRESMPEKFEQAQIELEIAKHYAQRVAKTLAEGKEELRSLGQAQLDLEDLQYDLGLDREMHTTVDRRIRMLVSQQESPGAER
jgi:chromosome segregation ATPase